MKNILITALILFTCLACNVNELDFSDLEKPKLQQTVAIPLGTISYTMRELIDKIGDTSLDLQEDSTSLIQLNYYDTASFDSGEDIIFIDDVLNSESIYVDATPASSESQVIQVLDNFTFNYPSEDNKQVDSVFYKAGQMTLTVSSYLSQDISYDIAIQNTRRVSNDTPVQFSGNLAGNSSASSSIDLSGHKTFLAFSETEGNTFSLDADISIFLNPGESIAQNDSIAITLVYEDQEFEILYGKFGQDRINVGNETLDVKFFSDLGESGLRFGSPEINFYFSSSFGLPMGVLFDGMYAVDSAVSGNDTIYLQGDATVDPQVVDAAASPGQFVASVVTLNPENSSLRELLGVSPNTIGFSLTALTNPEDASASNFVMDTSRISTNIEMKLPLELSLDNLTREIDFDLGDGLSFDETDSVSIRVVTENEFPFSAQLGLQILNENDSILHEVASNLIVEIPFLNLQGIVTQSRKQVSDVPLNKDGIEALKVGKKLNLILTLNTPKGNRDVFVKVLADYKIDIKVSAVGKLNIEL
ncbi:hypothetical protein [Marinoscillum sp.]|uniref:hypothetical protein n=1 Tax=Marinoscillum sp. TaxID=2024838 RepID=UPI003BAD2482